MKSWALVWLKPEFSSDESFRHGIRVLDLADVTNDAITKIDHAVLIDFADTFQTTEIAVINNASNYLVFLHHARKFGRQVLDYFGEPDYWDSICGITPGGESIVPKALPPILISRSYSWISLILIHCTDVRLVYLIDHNRGIHQHISSPALYL